MRTKHLLALTIALDVIAISVTLPLERYALQAVRDNAPIAVLAGLLAANFALLALVFVAAVLNGTLLRRIVVVRFSRPKEHE